MAQQPIELILLKQWASYLAIPIWLVDEAGNLLYYNEPAESLLGVRFEEAGEIHADRLAEHFQTTRLDGTPYPNEQLPIVVALVERVPSHDTVRVRGLDDVKEVTSVAREGGAMVWVELQLGDLQDVFVHVRTRIGRRLQPWRC